MKGACGQETLRILPPDGPVWQQKGYNCQPKVQLFLVRTFKLSRIRFEHRRSYFETKTNPTNKLFDRSLSKVCHVQGSSFNDPV